MEGEIVSAGTFVAAVLEQSGFLTQGRLLASFQDFFRDAGALVYFIAAVGGVLSVLMFGSFRAAQYLLIGPALYWFLVGPTVQIQGAVAKTGDGQPRGTIGHVGLEEAQADVGEVITQAGGVATPNIKVSQAFWLFAKPIDDFVEEFVGVMLKSEDGSDLAVGSKVRGLETIARSLPNQSAGISILEDEILKHCMETYSTAMGAAESYIKLSITKGISPKRASVNRPTHNKNFEKYAKNFMVAAENTEIKLGSTSTPNILKLIEDNGKNTNPKQGSEILKSLYDKKKGEAYPVISCAVAWNIYLELLWHKSAEQTPVLLRLASGEAQTPEMEKKACVELTRKIYDDLPGGQGANKDTDGECELRPGIALSLLWNHMSRRDTFARVLQRHNTDSDPLNSINQSAVAGITSLLEKNSYEDIVAAGEGLQTYANQLGVPVLSMVVSRVKQMGKNKFDVVREWSPSAVMNLIQGMSQSEQIDLPIYEMTRLRQQIFTWAMQLPYFQGLILYLISVAYPFCALIVLLPGRAPGFLNVPLAWLWVKSWDIGFAGVVLLEKVMYNLLPNWSVNPALRKGPWTYDKLPIILGEGYNFSHVQGVGYHYAILSTVTLGVPALMGALTLKAKKAILSNFVDAAGAQARDAGTRAAGGHSIMASNERAQILYELGGFAKQAPSQSDGGLEGGLRGTAAVGMAQMSASVRAMGEAAAKGLDPKNVVSSLGVTAASMGKAGTDEFLGRYANMVQLQAQYEGDMRAAFDPLVGRFGALQMSMDAAAAALDGAGARVSGGFETNNPKANAIDAYAKLSEERLKMMIDMSKAAGELEGNIINNVVQGSKGALQSFLKEGLADVSASDLARIGLGTSALLNDALEDPAGISKALASLNVLKAKELTETYSEGYGSQAAWARMWGVSPEVFADKDVVKAMESIEGKGGFVGNMLSEIHRHGVAESKNESMTIPGGNSFVGSILEGMGGNRTVSQHTAEELKAGIHIPPPQNEAGVFIRTEEAIRKDPLSSILGVGNPEQVFQAMQYAQELEDRKTRSREYEYRLALGVDQIAALDVFGGVDADNADQMAKALIERAKQVVIEDKRAGNRLAVDLPEGIDALVQNAPATAMDRLTQWYNKRQTNAMNEGLKQDASYQSTLVFSADDIHSPPYRPLRK